MQGMNFLWVRIYEFFLVHILKVRGYTYWQLGRHYGRQYASRKQGNALAN